MCGGIENKSNENEKCRVVRGERGRGGIEEGSMHKEEKVEVRWVWGGEVGSDDRKQSWLKKE